MEENMTLNEVLEELHFGLTNQDFRLTEILGITIIRPLPQPPEHLDGLFDKFPAFVFGEDLELSFKTLFMQRYDIRKIVQNDIDLFMHYWREKTNELLVKYAPKMQKWLDNFDDLFKFTVKLERDDTGYLTNGNQNTYYLNPVNATTTNLKVQDVDKSDRRIDRNLHTERDVLQSVWGKTRADIMEKIMDLKDIFNDCLDAFEVIFSVVI